MIKEVDHMVKRKRRTVKRVVPSPRRQPKGVGYHLLIGLLVGIILGLVLGVFSQFAVGVITGVVTGIICGFVAKNH